VLKQYKLSHSKFNLQPYPINHGILKRPLSGPIQSNYPIPFWTFLLRKRLMAPQFICISILFHSYNRGIQEMQSTSERRLAQNAYNILKQKGPDNIVTRLICMKLMMIIIILGSFRIMKQGLEC